MKGLVIFAILSILTAGVCLADDPGVRDTFLVETVYAELGDSAVDVRAFAICDDSIAFYNLPLTWTSSDSLISLSHVSYYNILIAWDETFDSLVTGLGFLRMLGFYDICGDDNPPLYWPYDRLHCWTFHFTIDSLAVPQIISIDTTYDPVNGSLIVGLVGGSIEFAPEFIPGAIYYGTTSIDREADLDLPTELALAGNYPNPFNPITTLDYSLPEPGEISISVYNILGQKVARLFEGEKPAGRYTVTWNASDYPSGVYFARLEAGGSSRSIKMLLLK
jgi:hypothetical protein